MSFKSFNRLKEWRRKKMQLRTTNSAEPSGEVRAKVIRGAGHPFYVRWLNRLSNFLFKR